MEERFGRRILPRFVRRTKEVAGPLPELYRHGLAEGEFDLALRGLLGEESPLAASTVARLRAKWEAAMLPFYRYPKEQWGHIRTTNVVESPFAALRLRTDADKRFKKEGGPRR